MNTGITLIDVRMEAMETIKALKNKTIDIKDAQIIKGLLDTVVDTAKTQVMFMQALPNSVKEQLQVDEVKAIAGTLRDRDAELDQTLTEIEKNNGKPYVSDK